MSASLVGSEMCIRDRRCAVRNCSGACPVVFGCACRRGAWRWTALKEPVSYTHLTLPTICSV
eukprot:2758657-Alexandrium_andersonii.AAC.1